ncbi:MAG: glycosyltransferase family 39 protein [Actinobacteria bacterium]|nr:glycosyltransferase family 39 protein [Actinomycetota bacterium]MCG2817582.1 glycosyltransferase family 39 protein [Actinomycetes bacterium]MBU4219790.1 glycosyltransferase family 39 protein [Actinomycetota bacterium]MBU4359846.1 glycosyltransferase family 39 protein [Actinomycetota bacterium]MBU4391258.1 glycosyltransferase family 39 protein [Actinomycetota bacterium]
MKGRQQHPLSRQNLTVLFFCVLGAGLRLAFLFGPMCHDEAETFVNFASKPLGTVISYYPYPNNQIFHTILVHFSTRLFGAEPWAVRLPAFIAGIALIPLTYVTIRKFFSDKPALLATGLTAVTWPLISFSGNARGYTILTLLFLLMMLSGHRALMKNDALSWVAVVVLATIGFFTAPTMLYFFGGLVVWLFLSAVHGDTTARPSKIVYRLAISCLLVIILVLLLYAPALIKTGLTKQVLDPVTYSLPSNSVVVQFMIRAWAVVGFFAFSVLFTTGLPLPVACALIVIVVAATVLLLYGFVLACIKNRRLFAHRVNLALVIIAWSALVVLLQGYYPPERVFIPFIPLGLGYASAGLCHEWSRQRSRKPAPVERYALGRTAVLAAVVALAVVVIVAQFPWQPRDRATMTDAEQMSVELEGILQPGDVVYIDPVVGKSLEYYCMIRGIPLSCIYGTREYLALKAKPSGRRFVIDDRLDGAGIDKTLHWGKLPIRKRLNLRLVAVCEHSTLFEIMPDDGLADLKGE